MGKTEAHFTFVGFDAAAIDSKELQAILSTSLPNTPEREQAARELAPRLGRLLASALRCNIKLERVRDADADDYRSSAMLGLSQALMKYDTRRASHFSTYLFASVRNNVRTPKRRAGKTDIRLFFEADLADSPARGVADSDARVTLSDAGYAERVRLTEDLSHMMSLFMELPERSQDILRRRYWLKEPHHVIGEGYQLTKQRVQQIENEAIGILRERMGVKPRVGNRARRMRCTEAALKRPA